MWLFISAAMAQTAERPLGNGSVYQHRQAGSPAQGHKCVRQIARLLRKVLWLERCCPSAALHLLTVLKDSLRGHVFVFQIKNVLFHCTNIVRMLSGISWGWMFKHFTNQLCLDFFLKFFFCRYGSKFHILRGKSIANFSQCFEELYFHHYYIIIASNFLNNSTGSHSHLVHLGLLQ